eukprot:CAMPEP_0202078582 /NCGR_PEP_ID=MMETSP0964-20121228/6018_1 /ASSEMBLY_ACC=CAM_ASM_000500 /TAXON_ID=4773 /ORGANISM="Schizochytrium aggregatum, Strain ATCC28209" /LENGTH=454 /DNA_ID=CAMNT_0048645895 /DNA_START=6 /DNA_END=1370 /DNA_ORIENTATION=+
MELFHEVLPIEGKRRVHFHEFMLQVHRMLHSMQQRGLKSDAMIDSCVEALYNEGWVLCFDEFQVTDIADAMVIRRLFESLLARGTVVVITSNRAPDELYKNGIQRDLFLPFIDDIKEQFDVVNLQSDVDYRMMSMTKSAQATNPEDSVYFVSGSTGVGQAAKYERLWDQLSKKAVVRNSTLRVQGRTIAVPQAARNDDVARFSFDDLCGRPRGAADYYAIASTFHTVFVDDVPQLQLSSLNPMRRFITMIDTFYDAKTKVVIHARAPMNDLLDKAGVDDDRRSADAADAGVDEDDAAYVGSSSNIDEIFAFDRTLSRLHEMNRADYLTQASKRADRLGPSPVRFLSQLKGHGKNGGSADDVASVSLENQAMTAQDIQMLWERYDRNGDGKIDDRELRSMLSEITLFQAGHRHVPEEVFAATRDALRRLGAPDDHTIQWESFRVYFERFGLTMRG